MKQWIGRLGLASSVVALALACGAAVQAQSFNFRSCIPERPDLSLAKWPGVCGQFVATSCYRRDLEEQEKNWLNSPDEQARAGYLGRYCEALRQGYRALRASEPREAHARFTEAGNRASDNVTYKNETRLLREEQARALDEARIGLAYALEMDGDVTGALALIHRAPEAEIDLAEESRHYMMVRHGLANDPAADPLRRDDDDDTPTLAEIILMPSFSMCRTDSCKSAASQTVPMTVSPHILFHTGSAEPIVNQGNRRKIQAIVRKAREALDRGQALEIHLTGHADQQCPNAPRDCHEYNYSLSAGRVETVALQVRAVGWGDKPLPAGLSIRTSFKGMSDPIERQPWGVAHAPNRRVEVMYRKVDAASPRTPTPQTAMACPWRVKVNQPGAATVYLRANARARSVRPESSYTVQLEAFEGMPWRHAYAFRCSGKDRQVADLVDLFFAGGMSGDDKKAAMRDGGRLPVDSRSSFNVGDKADENIVISLHVSKDRDPDLELLRAAKLEELNRVPLFDNPLIGRICRFTSRARGRSKGRPPSGDTDWQKVSEMSEQDIERNRRTSGGDRGSRPARAAAEGAHRFCRFEMKIE